MKRKFSAASVLVLLLISVLLTYMITAAVVTREFNGKLKDLDAETVEFQKLATIDAIVREHYALKVEDVALSESSILGYVQGLSDGYSRYLSADEYAEYLLAREQKDVFEIGLELSQNKESGAVKISYVESTSEAAQFGLKIGDTVVSIGGVEAKKDNFEDLAALLKGKNGETVGVTVLREKEPVTYTLTYQKQTCDLVRFSLELGQAGLIRIRLFEDGCAEELKKAIDRAIASGADALVFDVRGVRSVDFAEAVQCVDVIAGIGDLARVVTKGETSSVISGDGASVPVDCAVLTDGNSYGAPELFAACLRDTVGAKLVGTKTAGCASAQSDIMLNDKSAVILTTAVYLPPVSDSFEKTGVSPDLKVENPVDFGVLSVEEDAVVTEGYYLLKPDRRPGEGGEIEIPEQDPDKDDPTLIEPGMPGDEKKELKESK